MDLTRRTTTTLSLFRPWRPEEESRSKPHKSGRDAPYGSSLLQSTHPSVPGHIGAPIFGHNLLTSGGTKLKVTTRGGLVRYIYLDTKTFLDRRQTGVLNLPGSRQENFVTDYSNWRTVDGVKFPFNLDEDRTGPQITQSFATYTEKIELNVPMDDSLFVTPAGAGG